MTLEQSGSNGSSQAGVITEPTNIKELLAFTRKIADQLESPDFNRVHRESWRRLRLDLVAAYRANGYNFPKVLELYKAREMGFQFALADSQAYSSSNQRQRG